MVTFITPCISDTAQVKSIQVGQSFYDDSNATNKGAGKIEIGRYNYLQYNQPSPQLSLYEIDNINAA